MGETVRSTMDGKLKEAPNQMSTCTAPRSLSTSSFNTRPVQRRPDFSRYAKRPVSKEIENGKVGTSADCLCVPQSTVDDSDELAIEPVAPPPIQKKTRVQGDLKRLDRETNQEPVDRQNDESGPRRSTRIRKPRVPLKGVQ